jgi:hypothetical protein
VYFRDLAQRLLVERMAASPNEAATRRKLETLVLDDAAPRKARMHALWSLVGTGALDAGFHKKLMAHDDATYRAWAVRAAGNMHDIDAELRGMIEKAATDRSPDVQLQVAIAAKKIEGLDAMPLLMKVLASCGDDKLIPNIVWQNLHPLLEEQSRRFLTLVRQYDLKQTPNLAKIMPRVTERMLGRGKSK